MKAKIKLFNGFAWLTSEIINEHKVPSIESGSE